MHKSGEYLPGDKRDRYEQYEPSPAKGTNPSLEFNMAKGYYKAFANGNAWLFLNYRISSYGASSDDAQILARCASDACVNATDMTKLPTGEHWEVATQQCMCGPEGCNASACAFQAATGPVSVGCCEERPEVQRCDSWTWDDCTKLTPSLWHGNHCEDRGCCTLDHQHMWEPKCQKTYFPGGMRCKPFVAVAQISAETIVV